jgi:hypothetical protein
MPDVDVPDGTTERAGAVLRTVGRLGLLAYGVVHLLVAGLAVQVAFGERERADKKGALQAVAGTGAGVVLLWVVVVGLCALVVWQLAEAVLGHRGSPPRERALRVLINLAEAGLFGTLAWSAGAIAAKGGAPSTEPSVASKVLALPGGPVLVGLAGVVVVVGSAYAVRRGVRHTFLRELDLRGAGLRRSTLVTRVGQVGWAALGVAYGVPGVLLVAAAVRYDPAAPTTLDAGLQAVADQPWGPALLVLLALGLVAFGVYCFFDARYRRA